MLFRRWRIAPRVLQQRGIEVLPQEIIRTKRDGGELDPADIEAFVRGLTDGGVSEGQVAALAMAIFFRGMSRGEARRWR